MPPDPPPTPYPNAQLLALLETARTHFKHHNTRKTIDTLHEAHRTASQLNCHREAVQFRRALTILAGGGRPRLLTSAENPLIS